MADDFNTGDMLSVYLFENQQLLENLQNIVMEQKDADGFDEDSINEIFRTMHTIKGSSGIMMFDEITKVALVSGKGYNNTMATRQNWSQVWMLFCKRSRGRMEPKKRIPNRYKRKKHQSSSILRRKPVATVTFSVSI